MSRTRGSIALTVLVVLALASGWTPSAAAGQETTTILLVRHGETDAGGADPGLSPGGAERARELARVLADVGVHAVYSSQFRRARETAEPLAASRGLEVTTDAIEGEDVAAWARGFATRLLADHAGEVLLVSGHSNTVPLLIDALGAGPAPPIAHHEHDDLFVVTIHDGTAGLVHLHYGARSGDPGS